MIFAHDDEALPDLGEHIVTFVTVFDRGREMII